MDHVRMTNKTRWRSHFLSNGFGENEEQSEDKLFSCTHAGPLSHSG